MTDAAKRDLKRELEAANADLERVVMEALRSRKKLLDQQHKEELKAEIWRRRMRAVELERDYAGERLMKARQEADRAALRHDHDEYLRANREVIRYRVRWLNAADLLQKFRSDGPDPSARLLGGI